MHKTGSLCRIPHQAADPLDFLVDRFDLRAFVDAPVVLEVFLDSFPCSDGIVMPAHDLMGPCDAGQRVIASRAFQLFIGSPIELDRLFIFADLPVETGDVEYGPFTVASRL